MGRKRTKGNRSISGRLKKATTKEARTKHDYGNDRCVARLAGFRHAKILDGKAAWVDIYDGIGQLHAVGLLDGHGLDGKLLREAGREYIGLWNYTWIALSAKGSDLEQVYGGKPDMTDTRRDIRFAQLDTLLPIRSLERKWAHHVLLDFFGLDTVHPLVDRLVNFKMNQWGLDLPVGLGRDMRTAGTADFELLACVLRGLFALADGALPERRRMAA